MHRIRLILWLIICWILAGYLYILLRYVGHPGLSSNPLDMRTDVNFGLFFILATVSGIIVGLLHGLLELYFDRDAFRRISYGRLLVVKGITFFLLVTLMFMGVTGAHYTTLKGTFDLRDWSALFFSSNLIIPLLYTTLVAFGISFFRQISLKFGPGNLWKMLTGKFHQPREEERIFMFMDMKSSTTIAEKLGHIRFSQLIQDCFRELPVVRKYRAEIYQYVGDEVILSWSVESGIEHGNCVNAFFTFCEQFHTRRQYYLDKYGLVPEFKAGINLGMVTVAEIGSIRKEIAYHGDTLNTASRIEHLCTTLNKSLLMPKSLADRLPADTRLQTEYMGEFELRGKEGGVGICSVSRSVQA